MSSSSSSSSYSHSSSSTSTSSSSSSSHASGYPDVYYTDPIRGATQVSVDELVLFKVTDTTYGVARNTIDLLMNSDSILLKGELQNGWTLSAYPTILDQGGVDVSAGKCNWGSFDGLADATRYYDVFEDDNPDWDSDLQDSENSRRWYRVTYGANTTITHDAVNDAVDLYINVGLNESGYLLMSGEGIGEETSQGGSPTLIEGDFEIRAKFDILDRSAADSTSFAMFFTKDLDPMSDKVIIERYFQPSIPEDGFASAQAVSVLIPPQVAVYDDAQIAPVDLWGNGFKVTRIVDEVKTYYTTDNGGSWDLLGTYTWTEDDLFMWLGVFVWDTADTLRVRLGHFEMVNGATKKTRDITYNLTSPIDFTPGKLNLFDFYGENYRGGYEENHSWWFYSAPGTIVVDNLFPARNSNNVATDTNVSFDVSIPNDGIAMNSLDVELNIETACEQVRNYDYAILKGVAQTGYVVSYVYSELNRVLVDRFYENSIDIFTRWTIGAVGTWTQNQGVRFSSGAGTGESKLYSGEKGVIQGDFDIVMDATITIWPSTNAYVALEIDDNVNRIRIGRTVGPAKDVWRCDKEDSIGGFVTDVHEVNTSTLDISGVRLKRLNGSSDVQCYYLVDSPDWGWELLGTIPLSTNDVTVSLVVYNSDGGDPLGVTFTSIETLKGTGTFPGKISVTINPDSSFYEDSLPSPRINVRSWAQSVLTDYVWPFWVQALGSRNIKFWYPAVNPQDQLNINHGTDVVAPHLKLTKFSRMNETAAGVLVVRDLGYEEEQINLGILLATKCEVDNFKEFFFNVLKGKSRIFHYENYVTGDSANVRLLSDTIPIGVDGGHPYSAKMTLRKESISSSTSSTSSSSSLSSSSTALSGWQAPTMGHYHSMVLSYSSIEVFGSGYNGAGALGTGNLNDYEVHTQESSSATNWLQVKAGDYFSMGIKNDGTLWATGHNFYGNYGNGTTVDSQSFLQIGVGTNWADVACGGDTNFATSYTLAVKADGTLWSAGYNDKGQLGQGDTTQRTTFTQVGAASDWSKVFASLNSQSWALKTDGTMWRCGYNWDGQLGTGDYSDLTSFTKIGVATNWVSMASGYDHSVLLNSDGELWGCGLNTSTQLNLAGAEYLSLTQISVDTNWSVVTAGYKNTLAVKTNGTLWGCGANTYDELGIGHGVNNVYFTQELNSYTDWTYVESRWTTSLAINNSGEMYGCGGNLFGEGGYSSASWYNEFTLVS